MNHRNLPVKTPCWFVVNMCNRWGEREIRRGSKPVVVHYSLASAYCEAVKLADEHTTGDYAIFEAVGRVKSKKKKLATEPASLSGT